MKTMNRRDRRANLSVAKKRQSWAWEERKPSAADLARHPAVGRMRTAFVNDLYSVQVYDVSTVLGVVVHLIVRAHDGKSEPPWRDMQRIKNEITGSMTEAVQVYPREADVVDQANVYHLFVVPLDAPLPFGLHRENGLTTTGADAR